jgi:hypothetical protein
LKLQVGCLQLLQICPNQLLLLLVVQKLLQLALHLHNQLILPQHRCLQLLHPLLKLLLLLWL